MRLRLNIYVLSLAIMSIIGCKPSSEAVKGVNLWTGLESYDSIDHVKNFKSNVFNIAEAVPVAPDEYHFSFDDTTGSESFRGHYELVFCQKELAYMFFQPDSVEAFTHRFAELYGTTLADGYYENGNLVVRSRRYSGYYLGDKRLLNSELGFDHDGWECKCYSLGNRIKWLVNPE